MKKIIFTFLVLLICSSAAFNQSGIKKIIEEPGIENAYPRYSKDGKKVLYQSNRTGKWQLYIIDADGKNNTRITADEFNNNFPDWSPQNDKVVFVSDRNGNEDIYIMNIDGSELKNLSDNPARDIHPYFSPDGKKILFNSSRNDALSFEIYSVNIDGSSLKKLTQTNEVETCARYSPDMKKIVYLRGNMFGEDVAVMNADGTGMKILTKDTSAEGWPVWAGNDRIVYSSTAPGIFSLFVMNFDGTDKKQISFPDHPSRDQRAVVSPDRNKIVFNRQKRNTIGIYEMKINLNSAAN